MTAIRTLERDPSLQAVGCDTDKDERIVGPEVWEVVAESRRDTFKATKKEKQEGESLRSQRETCPSWIHWVYTLLAMLLGFEKRFVSMNSAKGRKEVKCS